MDSLILIPRLPVLLVTAIFAVSVLSLRWSHRNYSRHLLWGGIYFLNRLAVMTILFFCLFHPSLRYESTVREKKVLAVAMDRSMSMSVPDEEGNMERSEAVERLLADATFTGYLQENFDVHLYRFDSKAVPVRSWNSSSDNSSEGPLTAIRPVLNDITSRISPEILAGIVLLTDGVENTPVSAPDLPPVPVYAIGAGSMEVVEIIDRELQNLAVPQRVTVNSRVEASVMLRCLGKENRPIPLTLSLAKEDGSDPQTVVSVTAEFSRSGESRLCPASFIPAATGRFRLKAFVPVRVEEPLKENNDRTVFIDVVDPDIPVLYLEGRPRFEYKFFKRALEADEFIQLTSVLRIGEDKFFVQIGEQVLAEEASQIPHDLSKFKAVVLGDINPIALGDDWLKTLVKYVDEGGGLLLLGSKETFGPAGLSSALAPLVPFEAKEEPGRYQQGEYTLDVSRRGRVHPIFAGGLQRRDTPVVSGVYVFPSLKPSASVLAYLRREPYRVPGVLVQRYGKGRVLATMPESTWPWELHQGALGERATFFNQFWRQAVRWLAGLEEMKTTAEEPLVLRTDRYDYYAGEEVQITAFVSRDEYEIPPAVTAELEKPVKERFSFALDASASGGSYLYTAVYRPGQTGEHDLRVRALKKGRSETDKEKSYERSIQFPIKRSAREWEGCGLNEGFLKNLAMQTGGRYFALNRAKDLHAVLPATPSKSKRLVEKEIWNYPWALILICSMLSVEWGIRRRYERLKPE